MAAGVSDTSDNIIPEVKDDYNSQLFGNKAKEYEGVYDISSFADGYCCVDDILFISNSELLAVLYNDEKAAVYLYDIFDGSNEKLLEIEAVNHGIIIYPDCSAVLYKYDKNEIQKVTFYKNLRKSDNFYVLENIPKSGVASFNGKLVYAEEQYVYSLDTETGKNHELIALPFSSDSCYLHSSGEYLYINNFEYNENDEEEIKNVFVYNIITGESGTFKHNTGSLIDQGGNLSLFTVQDYEDMLYFVGADNIYASNLISLKSKHENPVWVGEDCFVTQQNDPESIVRLYDTKNNECVSEFRLNSEGKPTFGFAALSEDKRLIAALVYEKTDDGKKREFSIYLIILDDKKPTEGKYYYEEVVDYNSLTKQGKWAYDLGQKHGVLINLYESAANDYDPYFPCVLKDNDLIDGALKCLENVLEKFPDGFFNELCSEKIWKMEFNLTGKIESDEKAAKARAFYYDSDDNKHIIVVDCSDLLGLEKTFVHEIMHAIDTYIELKFQNKKNGAYPNWYNYLPKNFEYNDDYFNEDGKPYDDMQYVYTGRGVLKNVYFSESYQKTYQFEDRAVLFEYLFVTGTGFVDETAKYRLDKRFDITNIKDRAQYMCSVLRKCFKSVQATEQTQWEKALQLTADDFKLNVTKAYGLCA